MQPHSLLPPYKAFKRRRLWQRCPPRSKQACTAVLPLLLTPYAVVCLRDRSVQGGSHSLFSHYVKTVSLGRVRAWGGEQMGFVCLKLLRYQTSSQNSSVCGWVHWVLLTFPFLCSCCPHFMGFCLSFPVLTHGSWGTVRHLLAFAPTNPPQTNTHLEDSALERTSQAVGLPF